jgi:hypothetical protein
VKKLDEKLSLLRMAKAFGVAPDPRLLEEIDYLRKKEAQREQQQQKLKERVHAASPLIEAPAAEYKRLNHYPDGKPIPDALPPLYQSAANKAVPAGQNCHNCGYMQDNGGCSKWGGAQVRANYWCAKWEKIEKKDIKEEVLFVPEHKPQTAPEQIADFITRNPVKEATLVQGEPVLAQGGGSLAAQVKRLEAWVSKIGAAGAGGGAAWLWDLGDVKLGNNLSSGQAIIYDASSKKWINAAASLPITQSGNLSAYATKRALQYNENTKEITYSNSLDAVSPYITGYSSEVHVSPVAYDDTGKGTIGDPVKTIARAQVLAAAAFETTGAGERKTIVLHPGNYTENVTIDTQFTVLTTHELVGKNTTLSGTLTITKGCTIDGLKMNNLVITASSANGTVDIIGSTVSTAVSKTSSAYTVFRGCDLSTATLSVTGNGTVVMVGGNYFTVAVNNSAAAVLAKAVISMGPVTLTAGTLQLADTLIYSATNTSNAITQSAGSFLTVNNCQTLIPNLTNVSRNSFGGYYSILHSVYDKPNSTFTGVSLNAISYSQYINADRLILSAGGDILNSSGNSVICNIPCPTSSVPVTVTSTGTAGQLAYDSSHVYVCVATNTWRRASLSTW